MSRQKVEKWDSRIRWIKGEFPFAPLKLYKNAEGRLHRDDGPAYVSPHRCIWYQDGKKHGLDVDTFGTILFWFEGIMIPRRFFYNREELTMEEIFNNQNVEVRYVGLKIIGWDKVFKSDRFHVKDQDVDQMNHDRVLFSVDNIMNEEIQFIKVINATAERNGTFKEYCLAVPPSVKTCQEAVAWTFGIETNNYHPQVET